MIIKLIDNGNQAMSHSVSFCILDDLCSAYGPIHEPITEVSKGHIKIAVRKILDKFLESKYNDPSGYYQGLIDEKEINLITNDLFSNKYYVINRFEKYYVIAFALDYTRFEIYSKDCDKELINWGISHPNAEVTGIITDLDYNLNPVIKFMQQISNI